MSSVYLLCFAAGGGIRRDARANVTHYIGWTAGDVADRLAQHVAGAGSPLIRAVVARGQPVEVARVWSPADRTFERALKRRREAPRFCPLCVTAGRTKGRGLLNPVPPEL